MPPKKAKRSAPWAAINARKKKLEEKRALKEAQAAEAAAAAARGELPPQIQVVAKSAASPSGPSNVGRPMKKMRIGFATAQGTMYGIGTDIQSAREDMYNTHDQLSAEAGARALQKLSMDSRYNIMPPDIVEAVERQQQRRAGTFKPLSFLPPARVPGAVGPCAGDSSPSHHIHRGLHGSGTAQSPISVYSGYSGNSAPTPRTPYPPSTPPIPPPGPTSWRHLNSLYDDPLPSQAPQVSQSPYEFSHGGIRSVSSSTPSQIPGLSLVSGAHQNSFPSSHHFGGPVGQDSALANNQDTPVGSHARFGISYVSSPPADYSQTYGSQPHSEYQYAQRVTPMPSSIPEIDEGDEADGEYEEDDTSEWCAENNSYKKEVAADSEKRFPSDVHVFRPEPRKPALSEHNKPVPEKFNMNDKRKTHDPISISEVDSERSNEVIAKRHHTSCTYLSQSLIDEIYHARELFGRIKDDRQESQR